MSTVTAMGKITHEVMEPHLSGDTLWYTEETVTSNAYRCNGCGNIWAKKWYAETCEQREHRASFDQKYYYKAEGYQTTGKVGVNVYTRRRIGVDKEMVAQH